jgi:hypothetical protein
MGNFKDYINKKMAMLSLAMSNVEKNALSQKGDSLEKDTNHEISVSQGTMLQAMLRGEITKEVQELRWRMYKIDEANAKLRSKIVGKDEFGNNIVVTEEYDEEKALSSITSDLNEYKLIMVFENKPILKTFSESTEFEVKELTDEIKKNYVEYNGDSNNDGGEDKIDFNENEEDENKGKALGVVSLKDVNNSTEVSYPLIVDRDEIHTHDIETFTEKLYVRKINDVDFMLELLIQEKPNPTRKNSKAFVNLLNKAKDNIAYGSFLNIKKLMFVTNKTLGVKNNLLFEYDNLKFKTITTHKGFFHVKYNANVSIDGKDLLINFIDEELEEKYKNKSKK